MVFIGRTTLLSEDMLNTKVVLVLVAASSTNPQSITNRNIVELGYDLV